MPTVSLIDRVYARLGLTWRRWHELVDRSAILRQRHTQSRGLLQGAFKCLSWLAEALTVSQPFSERTSELLDVEVRKLVQLAHKRCTDLLNEKRTLLEAIAQRLLEKEMIGRADLIEILGERQFNEPDPFDDSLAWKQHGSSKPMGGAGEGEAPRGIDGGQGAGVAGLACRLPSRLEA